jgi:hypothetical protein
MHPYSNNPERLWVDGTHTAASERSDAYNLGVKTVDILTNSNPPKGSPISLLFENKPVFVCIFWLMTFI